MSAFQDAVDREMKLIAKEIEEDLRSTRFLFGDLPLVAKIEPKLGPPKPDRYQMRLDAIFHEELSLHDPDSFGYWDIMTMKEAVEGIIADVSAESY